MATRTWRDVVEESANAYRTVTGQTAGIKVGELPQKISVLNQVRFEDEYLGTLYIKKNPETPLNVYEIKEEWSETSNTPKITKSLKPSTQCNNLDISKDEHWYIAAKNDGLYKCNGNGGILWRYTGRYANDVACCWTDNSVYLSTYSSYKIVKINAQIGEVIWEVDIGKYANEIIVDSIDNVYTVGTESKKINPNGTTERTIPACEVITKNDIIFGVSNSQHFPLYKMDTNGRVTWSFDTNAAGDEWDVSVTALCVDSDEISYVIKNGYIEGKSRIMKISSTGQLISIFVFPSSTPYPRQIQVDANYNLYVAFYERGTVIKYDPNFEKIFEISLSTIGVSMGNFELRDNGNLYVTNNEMGACEISNNAVVKKIAYFN